MPRVTTLAWVRPLRLLRHHWGRLILALLSLLISTCLSLVFPFVIGRLLDSVLQSSESLSVNRLVWLLVAVFVGQAAFSFLQLYLLTALGEHIVCDLRTQLYSHLHDLALDFFSDYRIGDLMSRLGNDVTQVRSVLTSGLAASISHLVTLAGAFIILLTMHLRFTLFVVAVAVTIAVAGRLVGRVIQTGSTGVQEQLAKALTVATEALQSIRVVKSFERGQHEVARFSAALNATLVASLRQAKWQAGLSTIVQLMGLSALAAIMFYGGHQVVAGRLSTGTLTGFLLYGAMVASSLAALAGHYGQWRAAMGCTHRVFQILDLRPTVRDSSTALALPPIRGCIRFEDVSFSYHGCEPVLHGIALDIHAGETLALVGASGAGKTTLCNLIPRFHDATTGAVLIDGVDVRAVTQASLRAQMAIVPQDTNLFGGTIYDNILYGHLGASEADVRSAAREANAHEFIMQLPHEYQTLVGEGGGKLSGGQRQRIAIARAILRNPRILLLDEATSALDGETEAVVREALTRVMQGRTTIIIAHRLSSISAAHRIAVLDQGRIVELGSHNDLIKSNGRYASSYLRQLR